MAGAIIRRAKIEDARAIHEAHMESIREVCVRDHGHEEIKGWGFREFNDSSLNADGVRFLSETRIQSFRAPSMG